MAWRPEHRQPKKGPPLQKGDFRQVQQRLPGRGEEAQGGAGGEKEKEEKRQRGWDGEKLYSVKKYPAVQIYN